MKRKGFTLIELMIVVAIVAIVVAIIVPHIIKAIKGGQQSKYTSNQVGKDDGYQQVKNTEVVTLDRFEKISEQSLSTGPLSFISIFVVKDKETDIKYILVTDSHGFGITKLEKKEDRR
jgi:prepilin-type N-terminal cleavage/methylation domain-containing protein